MIPSIDQIAKEEYLKFAFLQKDLIKEKPICERCKTNPSIRINRFGPLKAFCENCLKEEEEAFNIHCKQQEEFDERHGDYY